MHGVRQFVIIVFLDLVLSSLSLSSCTTATSLAPAHTGIILWDLLIKE